MPTIWQCFSLIVCCRYNDQTFTVVHFNRLTGLLPWVTMEETEPALVPVQGGEKRVCPEEEKGEAVPSKKPRVNDNNGGKSKHPVKDDEDEEEEMPKDDEEEEDGETFADMMKHGLTELDVGILKFISEHKGFSGILKER